MTAPTLHELSITRMIAAPPEAVWQVWTERLAEWWAPKPWTTRVDTLEWHAGGAFLAEMIGPAGEVSPIEGVILEIVPTRRIVFTDAFTQGWKPKPPFMVGLFEFAAEGIGTRYTASARHWDAETMRQHEEMGFDAGWGQVADQLAALVEADRR